MNPRDLPEVVAELIIEMHEVRAELREVRTELKEVRTEIISLREEMRDGTNRLVEAFGRSMEPLINRVLDHESRLGKLENPE